MFATIDAALGYIKNKLGEFYGQSRVLRDRLLSIGKLMQAAKAKNDQQALGQLIVIQSQTKDLFIEQLALEQRLMPFASYFGIQTHLGALPIILAVSGVAVATALYLHFEKLKNQGKALELVAKGFLTPAEAANIVSPPLFGFGGGFGLMMPLVLAGGIGLYFLVGRR